MSSSPLRVLHVEVGGSYGGSLRALEVYLAHSTRSDIEHDLVFYYATPGSDRLRPLVRRLWALPRTPAPPARPERPESAGRLASLLRKVAALGPVDEARDWIALVRQLPRAGRLRRIMLAGRYDLVHLNNTFTFQAATLLAARSVGLPVVSHGRNPVRRGPLARAMLRSTQAVVTDSDALRQVLTSWGAPVPIRTCYNCVTLPAANEARTRAFRATLAPEQGPLVGSVGRLDEQKGYEFFVRAARRVAEVHPDVRFAIAGEGPCRARLERLVARSGLEDRFQLCGFTSDVADFVAALDLFVSSSLWEGLSLAIVEAMLLGKRVVATAVGGTREAVTPGRTGTLVPAGDADALAAAILEALDPRNAASFSAESARSAAAALAAPDVNADAFDRVLRQVARGRPLAAGLCPSGCP